MIIQPVIMSGGAGTRLWPLSRRARPKQFLNLVTDKSLFQETVLRLSDGGKQFAAPLIIAGHDHAQLVSEQLAAIDVAPADIILEPCPRNTAAVAAVAAAWGAAENPDAQILLSPADHHIEDANAFRNAITKGAAASTDGRIVTFGIKPVSAHTGYGYIQSAQELSPGVFNVAAFKEKPDAETARSYLESGDFYWNAGIFLFSPNAMLAAMQQHAKDIAVGAVHALEKSARQGAARLLDNAAFSQTASNSIDYAVMEKTDKAAVVAPVDVGWSDIGGWNETASAADAGRHLLVNCNDLILHSEGPVIGAVGVDNLIIIATGDAILVARRDCAQDIRKLADELKRRGREDLL
ncbi:mannose-1-phosphate guanylyltransferase [Hyphococcus sp.]|uniref:mannose-1-phosphate guanylyltransferase n=1 Tax=Hyphococcus sp. TaxID=2038636 RepID=UPI0037506ECD